MLLSLLQPSTAALTSILLDASNLQLSLRPGLQNLNLCSQDIDLLPRKLDHLGKALGSEEIRAIFDGAAFDGAHAGKEWECDQEVSEALPLQVRFTAERESADDALVALAQQIGESSGSSAPEIVGTGHVRHVLEQETLPSPTPVFAATLLKSAMGKGKRDKREAFLRTCGLIRMGDTVHLPCFDTTQHDRTLALIRGLHSIERGVVRVSQLSDPAAMVVTDDRGLRRRCFQLANPPVVFGRQQFQNWMERLDEEYRGPGMVL